MALLDTGAALCEVWNLNGDAKYLYGAVEGIRI